MLGFRGLTIKLGGFQNIVHSKLGGARNA